MIEAVRRHAPVAAYAVLACALFVALVFALGLTSREVLAPHEPLQGVTDVKGEILNESEPVSLSIPALSLEAPFTSPLGLDAVGEVEVPAGYEEVGWYKHGPTPGELGPAVVLGHVDSVDGPAVFYNLGQLAPEDEVVIRRADGSVAVFEVTALERYEQAQFPTTLVYGDIDHAGLRLITCSGYFDKGEQRYSHNLVVYAKLIGERTGEPEDR